MAQQATASVQGQADLGDVVSFTDDDGVKRVYLVDDVLPGRDKDGHINYILTQVFEKSEDRVNRTVKRSDLLAPRWVFGS